MDSNPSRPSVSTHVDTEMHKEDQQATVGPTSLGVTSEERANPQFSNGQTKSISDGLEIVLTQPTTTEKGASFTTIHGDKEEASSTIKLEDLAKLVSQIQPSFKDLDSPEDDHVVIVDESDEDKPNAKTKDTLLHRSLSPSLLTTDLKDLRSKFNELTKEIKGLKTQVHELEIKLPNELKEIPTKLKDFTKTATSLTSQVAKLKTLQWELLEEFLSLPAKVESAQAKLKTLDALLSLLLNVTKALNKFAERRLRKRMLKVTDEEAYITGSMVKSSKEKKLKKFDFVTEDGRHIYLSEEQINNQKKLEEEAKAIAAKGEVRKAELIDLLGPEDPLDKLNNLANKKRKHVDDIHDYVKQPKRLSHQQDFVTIEDLNDFSNAMLYTVQEIFFKKQHQGTGVDDHARTFNSLLLVEVDKRNLNPLK
uniref:Uncharacterized protein n=1 Tax=Tanacetum cinerariifolium TaxID=118510 RepID=A0A6L2NXV7_TANCI|nr:hypothetical protein [Tanacetum cinerariifolium]